MVFQTVKPDLSQDFKDLTQRERDLLALAAKRETEPAEMAALWEALATDYEAERHNIAANRCRRRIGKLTWNL